MSHVRNVCQYGTVHGQCRCPGPVTSQRVTCPTPEVCVRDLQAKRPGGAA